MNSPTPLPRNLTLLTLLYNSLASLVAGLGSSVSHSIPYGTEECMVIRVPPEPHVVRSVLLVSSQCYAAVCVIIVMMCHCAIEA